MVLAHELAPSLPDLVVARTRLEAEHGIGIGLVRAGPGGAALGALPRRPGQPERCVHAAEEVELACIDRSIGTGDREQRDQHVLEHQAVVGERVGKLGGERLEIVGARTRLVEQPADLAGALGWNAEAALEGVDLGAVHRRVDLGKLGGQHHGDDGEQLVLAAHHGGHAQRDPGGGTGRIGGDARARVATHGAGPATALRGFQQRATVGGMPECRADHGSGRSANSEPGDRAEHLAPDRHALPNIMRQSRHPTSLAGLIGS